ncbi:hypothetical protein GGI04_001226 [Coemansia thaxteri]|nr:hypothetical protein GGI04_001226 [Coemansia thaxteri]KAJ2473324.1 hypothetical protein GGI02_000947 [Coemansia sp. RSA 2322]KAJ2488261.1 hypothetical protein EV174_000067 [Coemansia sp. RSA 2320]
MKEPPPRHSQFSKFYMDNDDVDYNMKSPLGPIVGYPCRNFKAGPVQGTMIAGHPFRVQFDGVATHLGGDCQFAVSYDNGTTFAVIWDKVASCFLDTVNGSYDVPVPDTIPASKKATFAWTWINALGSREYYMNCADVRIENYGRQVPLTAHELLVVNLPGKQTLSPKSGREEDRLPAMLQQRSFVTVGKDTDLEPDEQGDGHSAKPAGGSDDAQADGEADPVANRASSGKGDDDVSLPDEITSYVYTTRTIVEDGADGDEANPDDGFTYNDVDDYKSRRKSSNGLTVLSDETDISEYLGSFKKLPGGPITSIPFNMDDTLPLATHHLTSDDNLDQWPSSSVSALPGSAEIGSESSHSAATLDLGLALPALETGAVSMRGASLGFPGGAPLAAGADMVTQFKTITISNKPVLQIVVSSNRTAVPESLTLSVSA